MTYGPFRRSRRSLRWHQEVWDEMNLKKCVFSVTLGHFLGYLIFSHGIKANPDTIQAIVNRKPSNNLKVIQQLNGRIVALNRFISNCTEKCLLFFKLLRKKTLIFLSEGSDIAFQEIKQYFGTPSILVIPNLGEILYLYQAIISQMSSVVLLAKRNKVQHAIYYINHIITNS